MRGPNKHLELELEKEFQPAFGVQHQYAGQNIQPVS